MPNLQKLKKVEYSLYYIYIALIRKYPNPKLTDLDVNLAAEFKNYIRLAK